MANYVRRIVSGHKARYKDDELNVELDLVYLTDRIIIMGYPAEGLERYYRNPREDAKRLLDTRHGDKYRVFNFCPIRENSYPASVFDGRVSRYPWPDHHAPPIGLLALATQEMEAWLKQGDDYTVVVHCKAGKGRSGTIACSLLLRMDDAIEPPKLKRSYNASEWADKRADEIMQDVVSEAEAPRATISAESDIPPTTDGETSSEKGENNSVEKHLDDKPKSNLLEVPVGLDHAPHTVKVDKVLKLHTSRRMKRTVSSQGVSIPSQRRWLRYWSEILHNVNPPQLRLSPDNGGKAPKCRLYNIRVRMRDSGGGVQVAVVRMANLLIESAPRSLGPSERERGATEVWVSLARYEDEMVEELERRVRAGTPVEYEADGITRKDGMFATDKWDNKKMVKSFARMGVAQGQKAEVSKDDNGTILTYNLVPLTISSDWVDIGREPEIQQAETQPPEHGVLLDSSREFRVKLYVGQVFMGWMWFIPCFHLPQPPINDGAKTTIKLTRSDVDFPLGFGALLMDIELTLGWDMETTEEQLPREPERTASGHVQEPKMTGVLAAAGGNIEALQGARD
ncbi:SubName: Full=Related to Phosphatidylinositol-3,4,5-trisphosphate 3-phosphatase PTEN {ECO:0000313/EMBL:CCA69709.1} [Serendipita indica DSM 11827]|nr:SubName: Full=Related to Phosphatidylinositol-3,4,5-trisphosphate 3-phosphatase PTEN {ECO:0000313/EMBL:CCA69709.1} [Serendipita indica DSM 11827]